MKKCILLFLLATSLVSNMFGQFTPGSEEKIAKYISGKSEEEIKTLFTSNGYTVNLLIKGYPECLDKYVFYADAYRVGGEEAKNFNPPLKAFTINKGRIETTLDKRLSCGIAFTLTAKNNLSTDCMIFVGTNGWAYIYQLYKFEKAIPMILDVQGMTFTDNMLRPAFSFYIVTDNNQKGENQNYNFSQFNNKLTCKTALLEYDDAYSFADGLAKVKSTNGWVYGYVNKYGKEYIPIIYTNAGDFSEGAAYVEYNKKYGYLNTYGSYLIAPKYDYAYDFSEGYALVKLWNKYFFIDKSGNKLSPKE